MITRQQRLHAALTAAFSPVTLEVIDDSAQHAGHSGAADGGQTHYTVRMVSDRFVGLNRVARSRAVHEAVTAEFHDGLHALALMLRAPNEP